MIKYYNDIVQGSDEWKQLRAGILTASRIDDIITTKTLKPSSNQTKRLLIYKIMAERKTGYVEEEYQSYDMMRGQVDEITARQVYSEHYAPVKQCGFISNANYKIGYSPDGLVGDDGLIEIKSRLRKLHIDTMLRDEIPSEHIMQLQSALLVSDRKWIDYISFSSGLPMYVKRVYPDKDIHNAIIEAVNVFEQELKDASHLYDEVSAKYPQTELNEGEIEV